MNDKDKYQKIANMCREILDAEEPFYWNYDLSRHDKDLTIDLLLRAVLGFAEADGRGVGSTTYIESKFYGAYNKITGKKVVPN